MRYSESKEAVASGLIEKDEVIEGKPPVDPHRSCSTTFVLRVVEVMQNGHQQQDQQQGSHLKKDGTEDKRYKENRSDRYDD